MRTSEGVTVMYNAEEQTAMCDICLIGQPSEFVMICLQTFFF